MTPIEILKAAKASIAADPTFNLNHFCQCIAPHICRAAGDTVVNETAIFNNGEEEFVAIRGYKLLGAPKLKGFPRLFHGALTGDHKSEAYRRLDRALDYYFITQSHQIPEPVVIPEPEQEPILALI